MQGWLEVLEASGVVVFVRVGIFVAVRDGTIMMKGVEVSVEVGNAAKVAVGTSVSVGNWEVGGAKRAVWDARAAEVSTMAVPSCSSGITLGFEPNEPQPNKTRVAGKNKNHLYDFIFIDTILFKYSIQFSRNLIAR
jgi:hypothetical protein